MKKIALGVLGCTLAVAFSYGAQAFDIGGAAKSVAKDIGKAVVLKETNQKISELAAQCKCDVKTGKVTNCDYAAVKKIVNPVRTGLKAALNRDADFYVYTASDTCSSEVQSNVTGWWSWHAIRNSDLKSVVKMELQ